MALWPYGPVVLWLHGLAWPRSSLTLVPGPRSALHSFCGLQVARTRLSWSVGRTRTAPVVRMSRAHGSIGPQVARA